MCFKSRSGLATWHERCNSIVRSSIGRSIRRAPTTRSSIAARCRSSACCKPRTRSSRSARSRTSSSRTATSRHGAPSRSAAASACRSPKFRAPVSTLDSSIRGALKAFYGNRSQRGARRRRDRGRIRCRLSNTQHRTCSRHRSIMRSCASGHSGASSSRTRSCWQRDAACSAASVSSVVTRGSSAISTSRVSIRPAQRSRLPAVRCSSNRPSFPARAAI